MQENRREGLTSAQVAERVRQGKVNILTREASKSAKEIVKDNIFTYFNLIFLILAVLVVIGGSLRSLTFLPVIIANTVIGIVQQLHAKRILDRLAVLAESNYEVIRDGQRRKIPMSELVSDDLIVLEAGMQIPADAVLLDGRLMANESLLTGESDEIEKLSGSELKSGSFVVSGQCLARLTQVGDESYISRLTAEAKEIKEKQSEMVNSIEWVVKIAGIAIIPIGITLFLESFILNEKGFSESITSMVAAVIGMIPEGLYLLVTIALAMSAARLAGKKVLLHDMHSTETLARVDVLCVDKTGTITDNEMHVIDAFGPQGKQLTAEAEQSLSAYIATSTDNNITMQALRTYYEHAVPMPEARVTPFSSKNKFSCIDTPQAAFRFGAPEFLLSDQAMEENRKTLEERTGQGQRVLALVRAQQGSDSFQPLAFVALENGLRPNVEDTFAYFREQEVQVRVISGDNPQTVSSIAQGVGIPDADRYVDASRLNSAEDIRDAVEKYRVFGRVKPEQKKAIIMAIKETGKKVAMTGDGVNDILAMKEADCSIAMGSGSDAARQAAQVVLLDDDFSHMREIISEGRRDINNITRSATLFLYKNMFSAMLALCSIILVFAYPLEPAQISLVSAFNIGLPAFLLAFEPNTKKQHAHFFRSTMFHAFPASLTSFIAIAGLVGFADVFGIRSQDVATASTYLLSIAGFMVLYRIIHPLNIYRAIVLAVSIAGFILGGYFFSGLFNLQKLSFPGLLLAGLFAIAQESVVRNLYGLFDWVRGIVKKQKEQRASKQV